MKRTNNKKKLCIIMLVILCLICAYFLIKYFLNSEAISRNVEQSQITESAMQNDNAKPKETSQQSTEEAVALKELQGDPYYIEEQPGYEYKDSKTITYYSKLTGTTRHAMIFLPADYSENKTYPVLYLLHGMGGSHVTWRNKNANVIMQNLYYFENVPEMIVVCPNCNVNEEENTDGYKLDKLIEAFDGTAQELTENLMPYIETNYPVKKGRENTAIAGNSLGGRNTLYTAFTHQDLFGYVGAFSSSHVLSGYNSRIKPLLNDMSIDPKYGGFKKLLLVVGTSDDVCGNVTYQLDEYMTKHGIVHDFYDTEGGHENTVWQNALYNYAKMIFAEE